MTRPSDQRDGGDDAGRPGESLAPRLFQSLDNAVANGYVDDFERTGKTIYEVDPRVLAVDTCDCDSDFNDCDPDDLIPLIREWQAARRPG